jgi:hypothetical protein
MTIPYAYTTILVILHSVQRKHIRIYKQHSQTYLDKRRIQSALRKWCASSCKIGLNDNMLYSMNSV